MTVGSSEVRQPLGVSTAFPVDFTRARGSFPWAPDMTVVVDIRPDEDSAGPKPPERVMLMRGRQLTRRCDARKKVRCGGAPYFLGCVC